MMERIREVFTVVRHDGGWAVEHDGEITDATVERDEAMASACRRARSSTEAGQPARIRMQGDPGFNLRY